MTHNNEGSGLMSSALLAGSLFAIVTAPLAIFSSHPFDLELQGKTLFSGKLEDVASLYIGVAAAASLGVGALGSGSGRKKNEGSASVASPLVPSASSDLSLFDVPVQDASALSMSEALSPLRLKASGLDFFLEDDLGTQCGPESEQEKPASQVPETVVPPAVLEMPTLVELEHQDRNPAAPSSHLPSVEPELIEQYCDQQESDQLLVLEGWTKAFLSERPLVSLEDPSALPDAEQPMPVVDALPSASVENAAPVPASIPPIELTPSVSVVTSASGSTPSLRLVSPVMPAAQTYLSFTHSSSTEALYAPEQNRNLQMELEALEKLEQVREQIQVLSAQMEMLQSSLSLHDYSAKHLVALPSTNLQPSYTVSSVETSGDESDSKRSQRSAYVAAVQRAMAS